jgi:hypothetical protein
MTIPREILLTHLFCAAEDESVVLARLHLTLDAAEGSVRVSNGQVACKASWADPEGGVDQEVELNIPVREARALADMAKKEPVIYDADRQVFTCGSFELQASEPVQRNFDGIGEVPLDLDSDGAKAKAVRGARVKTGAMKKVGAFLTKAKLVRPVDDLPMSFYGADAPVRIEIEQGDMAFTFMLAQYKLSDAT